MIIYVLIIAGLILHRASFRKGGISQYYISKEGTDAVRGIFILLIMASHFTQYILAYPLPADVFYMRLRTFLGQFVVCMFLFYSGYGVTLSFAEKGEAYRKQFPRKRILRTLLIFDLAVVFYYIVQHELGVSYPVSHYILTMLAWNSFGNSNWYIFAILGLYCISYLTALSSDPKNGKQIVLKITASVTVFTELLICAGKEDWWYNILFCYPLGAAFYYLRPAAEDFVRKPRRYFFCFLTVSALFLLIHKIWKLHLFFYEADALLFTSLVVLTTMKVELKSPVLRMAGRHLFELFLVHRIPMILLGHVPFIKAQVYLYFALSMLSAFVCAFLFKRLVDLMSGKPRKE